MSYCGSILIGSEAVIVKILRFYDRSNKHIRYSEALQHIFNYYPIETFDNARYFGKLLQKLHTYVEKKKESKGLVIILTALPRRIQNILLFFIEERLISYVILSASHSVRCTSY